MLPAVEQSVVEVAELFKRGEVRRAHLQYQRFTGQQEKSARRNLCLVAREKLVSSEPSERFGGLWMLMLLDLDKSLDDFVQMSGELSEHPRVRGLGLEAIGEALFRADMSKPWARRTVKHITELLSDPEPEVRWWACYAASRTPATTLQGRRVRRYKSSIPLIAALDQLRSDPTVAGLGWSVGEMAQDALQSLTEGILTTRNWTRQYDPWNLI